MGNHTCLVNPITHPLISSSSFNRASDKCLREKRKTINGDDLLWAMSTLGFESYMEPLRLYLQKFRHAEVSTLSGSHPMELAPAWAVQTPLILSLHVLLWLKPDMRPACSQAEVRKDTTVLAPHVPYLKTKRSSRSQLHIRSHRIGSSC